MIHIEKEEKFIVSFLHIPTLNAYPVGKFKAFHWSLEAASPPPPSGLRDRRDYLHQEKNYWELQWAISTCLHQAKPPTIGLSMPRWWTV